MPTMPPPINCRNAVEQVPREWRSALQKLTFMAETSGGVSGPDAGRIEAIAQAKELLARPYIPTPEGKRIDMTTVIEIVKAHLVENGFDGLISPDAECGCLCDDLAPCFDTPGMCRPGYRGVDARDHTEWAIYPTKEAALASVAAAREGAQG